VRREEDLGDALLRALLRALLHAQHFFLLDHRHAELDEVANHRLDVAPDVADLRVARRLHLHERRGDERREAAGDLRLADAGRTDEHDVLRRDVVALLRGELLPAPAVAQGDRDHALRVRLPDDVAVELLDDALRRQVVHLLRGVGLAVAHASSSMWKRSFV
jgi:hypothetical protein